VRRKLTKGEDDVRKKMTGTRRQKGGSWKREDRYRQPGSGRELKKKRESKGLEDLRMCSSKERVAENYKEDVQKVKKETRIHLKNPQLKAESGIKK